MISSAPSGQTRSVVPARVLIVLSGSIGDVVRALPLLGRIRAAWPEAHLAWAIEPKSAPILRNHPWLNELIIYDRRRAPWSFIPFLREIRRGRFDLAIDLQRHLKSGIIGRVSGAKDRVGFAPTNVKEFNHRFSTLHIAPQLPMRLKLMQYQAFGDLLGLSPAPIRFGLEPTSEAQTRARQLLGDRSRPRVAVILGSSWPSRIYFPASIAIVIRQLHDTSGEAQKFTPVLIGGPDDAELASAVQRELGPEEALNLVGKTKLDELAAIFAECDIALGPDSGPMHIAAAVGCPIVSLWGATAAERSAPWGFAEHAIIGAIPCSPCYLRECPIGRECMRRIAPERVADQVRRAFAANHAAGEKIAAKAAGSRHIAPELA